jgi:pre-mRNA-splicing factor 38A
MANRTDPTVTTVHGTNPQFLVEKILRQKIYNSLYWKEHCFGLTAETLVDKAVGLSAYGGQYGGMQKPTKFMCLILKMLQLQPEKEIVVEFIKNEDYKYLRVLGAFYLRLVGKPLDIYQYLEPLYNDYRKLRFRGVAGWALKHMDEYIEELLTGDYCCDVALPHLPKRHLLEDQKLLAPRISALEDEDLDLLEDAKDGEGEGEEEEIQEPRNGKGKSRRARSDDEEEEEEEQVRERGDKESRRRHRRDRSASPPSRHKRERARGRRDEAEMDDDEEERHTRRRRRRRSRSASRSPKRRRRHSRSASRSRSPRRAHGRDRHDDRRRRRSTSRERRCSSPSPSPSPSPSSSSSNSPRKHSSGSEDEKKKKAKKRVPAIKGLKLHKVAPKAEGGSSSGAVAEGSRGGGGGGDEKSVGEWNEMRAKLGLKPLQE